MMLDAVYQDFTEVRGTGHHHFFLLNKPPYYVSHPPFPGYYSGRKPEIHNRHFVDIAWERG